MPDWSPFPAGLFQPVLQKDQPASDCVGRWRQDTGGYLQVETKIPMISVVIPVHNEAALLGGCLEAIERAARDARLESEPVEVVVVLDACTDRSAAIAGLFRGTAVQISVSPDSETGVRTVANFARRKIKRVKCG